MNNFLQQISKTKLALVVLAVGALLIILSDPPKDRCDAQLRVFSESQKGFLSSLRGSVSPLWLRAGKYCKETKDLGGCSEFFQVMRNAMIDLNNSSPECVPRLLDQSNVQGLLSDSVSLMVSATWGDGPPTPGPNVYRWMTPVELALFCQLQSKLKQALDDEKWEAFVRQTLAKLPERKDLRFQEVFERSLFSVRCSAF